MTPEILRLSAFTDTPDGGNPAGVVLEAEGLEAAQMMAIAAEVGFSETAFLVAGAQPGAYLTRYFAPQSEIPFCGHATIATAVALAERDGVGTIVLETAAGRVAVQTREHDGRILATLTSVQAHVEDVSDEHLKRALAALGWSREDLDPAFPPRIGFGGARHLILAAATRERLAELDYDFDALLALSQELDLITVDLVWREHDDVWHARNPFPLGGVVEDPATGAAAAAFGAYLRELGLVARGGAFTIHQGHDMGRPSTLRVELPAEGDAVRVSGGAVVLPEPG